MRSAIVLLVALGVVGCSRNTGDATPAPGPSRCAAGDQPLFRDMLYFGRNKPSGGPRFPSGLTVVHAMGQWRGASGQVEREKTAIVSLLHNGEPAAQGAVTAVAAEYKSRFGQEAVLRERILTCSSF